MDAARGRPPESMKHGFVKRCSTVFLSTSSTFLAVNSLFEQRKRKTLSQNEQKEMKMHCVKDMKQ
jgi:hypothetical protein